jgi:Domain of unknown function (DUF4384)
MSPIRRALFGFCVGAAFAAAGFASAEEDGTRAVTILDGAPLAAPAPLPPAPAPPESPTPPPPPTDKPSDSSPAPASPAPSAPRIETVTVPPVAPMPSPDVPRKGSPAPIRLANSAELAVDMTPGGTMSIGSRVSFRITSKKAGYVVLVDVDATGKLTQIYPNILAPTRGPRANVNAIKPGVPLLIPSAADALGGIAYVVSPPVGSAMVIAIWSEQPVQILDLPDIPVEVKSQTDALDYLTKRAGELRIPDARSGRLREANWSFDAKFYAIR